MYVVLYQLTCIFSDALIRPIIHHSVVHALGGDVLSQSQLISVTNISHKNTLTKNCLFVRDKERLVKIVTWISNILVHKTTQMDLKRKKFHMSHSLTETCIS